MGKAFGDFCGAMTTALCSLGDRLGLFKALAEGPARSEELAERAGIDPRYALEWLRGMTAAGYVEHDRESGAFTLPPAHAPVLAAEGGPMFLGGAYQETMGMLAVFDAVVERARSGGGVDQAQYPADFWDGLAQVHERLVREPPGPGVDPGDAGPPGKARGRRFVRRRRLRRGPRVDQARRGVSGLAPRRLRCLRPADRKGGGEREAGGGRRPRALREARRRVARAARRSTT